MRCSPHTRSHACVSEEPGRPCVRGRARQRWQAQREPTWQPCWRVGEGREGAESIRAPLKPGRVRYSPIARLWSGLFAVRKGWGACSGQRHSSRQTRAIEEGWIASLAGGSGEMLLSLISDVCGGERRTAASRCWGAVTCTCGRHDGLLHSIRAWHTVQPSPHLDSRTLLEQQ